MANCPKQILPFMHTRASNSKLVDPLPEPERTLNRRLHRRNRRVPYDQRNNPPQHPRIVYQPILDIKYFRHFLDIIWNYDLMDDEPMWAADRFVAPTLAFSQHENESLTDAWLRMKEMLRNCHGHNLSKGNIIKVFYHGLSEITQEVLNVAAGATLNQTHEVRSNSKAYQSPQSRNEHVNVVFTRSGKSYDPPNNPNDQQNNSKNPINFDSDDEDDEPTPQLKTQPTKPVKETSLPKPYKLKIPYPQRLRKEKIEAQYRKFLDMIRAVRINVPLVDVLAEMPNYGKFFKELISNKHKIEQIYAAFLSDESFAMIQNKVPPKLGDPGSFLIPCNFNKTFSCNALADLGASINLMSYSLYAKLSLKTLKPTKISVRLVDRSFQYPVGIAENMLIEVGKFTFPADFVILKMEEDRKVPLILGRPFLHTTDAVIRVKQKQLNLGVGTEHQGSKILHSIEGTLLKEEIFFEFDEIMAMIADENSKSESDTKEPPFEKITINTNYKIKTSLEEPPTDLELKPLPDNLEYVFLEEPSFLPVIISSKLSTQNKSIPVSVLKKHKEAFTWKTTDIPATFLRCMLAIFHDMIEESLEVFMDDFSVFGDSFDKCLNNLDKMLQHCKDAHFVLNWEKCHFMVNEGIVLGHKVSGAGLVVDKAKIIVISKLPPPTNIKGIRRFLGHAGFY
ncbi:reverse transcriptase domain-containing protein [Tanacetum coccineum]